MAYSEDEPRDERGRWTSGIAIPDYVKEKINANFSKDELHKSKLATKIQEAEDSGKDSLTMHMTDGKLSPERQALHDQIIEDFTKGKDSKTGYIYALGGAPANGKSSLVESGFLQHPANAIHVDPDAIKAKLPEYTLMVDQRVKTAASFNHEESSLLSKKLQNRGLELKQDMIIDGIGDGGIDKIVERNNAWRAAGYKVRGDYVTLDTDLSLKLAQERGLKTGRYVPDSYVKEMNKEVSNLVPKLTQRNAFDELNLWDTNTPGKPKLILSHKNGTTKIFDQELYNRFLKKAKS